MRKGFAVLAGAVAGLGIANASAADLPVKAPAYVPPAVTWTGPYLGGHLGAGWGTVETSVDVGSIVNAFIPAAGLGFVLPLSSHNINGLLAGVQLGYNWQVGSFVYGLEGDFSWSDIEGNAPCLIAFNCQTEVKWMADVTARIGVLPVERLLVYLKGGVVWADTDYSFGNSITVGGAGFTASVAADQSDTRIGGLLGFGAEYMFAPNWTAKIEYNYMDFGDDTYNIPVTAAVGGGPSVTFNAPVDIDQKIHAMKIGVNYKF